MNKKIASIFTIVCEGKVICVDTNLLGLWKSFKAINGEIHNYQWFYRRFSKETELDYQLGGKPYLIQKFSSQA